MPSSIAIFVKNSSGTPWIARASPPHAKCLCYTEKVTSISSNPPLALLPTPLVTLHTHSGTQLSNWFGCSLPNDFGDWLVEYRHLHDSSALLDENHPAVLDFTCPRRRRYLNPTLTTNIK